MSKLARCLPREVKLDGGELAASELVLVPESIWKGNEPRPFDMVDSCDPVDIPSILRLGTGRGDSGGAGGASVVAFVGASLKVCCASGERGGVRMGLSEIGDGGTKWKPSRIESARVDVVITDA